MPLVFLLYALFASVFTIAKTGLQYTEPLFFIGTRMTAAGALLLTYTLLIAKEKIRFNKDLLLRLLLLSAFNIYLTNMFEFLGLKHLSSFKTCFLYSLSPFLSALFSYWVLTERMTPKKWLGMSIGFLGFIPALVKEGGGEGSFGTLLYISWPEIAVMLAAACSVYGWVLLRQTVKDGDISPLSANGCSMLIGGAAALLHSCLTENWSPVPVSEWRPFIECSLLLILISNIICYNLYGYLLRKFTATFMSFAGFTTPLFTALFGWIFLGEVVTWPFYLSTAIVFCGLLIFNQEELRQGYAKVEA